MCGRFVAATPPDQLAAFLHVDAVRTEAFEPSWNVAPTDRVYAVAQSREAGRVLGSYRWGLVPHWATSVSSGARMINVRAEKLTTTFARTFERRRCLVPADGFYEWERVAEGGKVPWFFHRSDGAPMTFAGLWEVWYGPPGNDREPGAEPLRTCTIITTRANDVVAPIHDRMPAVLAPDAWDAWLDRDASDLEALRRFLEPPDPRWFERYEVDRRVGNVRNNDADLLTPVR